MKKITNLGLSASLCFWGMFLFSAEALAVNQEALEYVLQGHTNCKSAHMLRRKDLAAAKSAYANYESLKQQAISLDEGILEAKDAEIDRAVRFCNTVGADLARTEALPLFSQGVAACGKAAEYVRKKDYRRARKAYSNYLDYKKEAIAISEAILKLRSVRTDVRRCDRVLDEIETASAHSKKIHGQFLASVKYLEGTLALCKGLSGPDVDIEQVDEIRGKLVSLEVRKSEVPNKELLEQGKSLTKEQLTKVATLNSDIDSCFVGIQASVEAKEQEIAQIAEEEARKQDEARKQRELIVKKALEGRVANPDAEQPLKAGM